MIQLPAVSARQPELPKGLRQNRSQPSGELRARLTRDQLHVAAVLAAGGFKALKP